jgi:pimeloyl-ACP methyl ester carboxylesterase
MFSILTLTILRCRSQGIPISLMYGKEDPWVGPFWGTRVKQQVPEAPYYQISPAGHCPHDEVPEVNHCISCYNCRFPFGFISFTMSIYISY